jgi:hypothetical protein
MLRRLASLSLVVGLLCLGLGPVLTPAQIPVTDVAHIAVNQTGWILTLTQWVSQLSYMLRQYQQLVATYTWAQHIAQTLNNPDKLSVLAVFAIVDSATLTRTDKVADYRRMVEGRTPYSSNLGSMYGRIYGTSLDMGHMAPRGPEDWTAASGRMNTMVQGADAAILETLALVSKVNKSLSDINSQGTYTHLQTQIKTKNATPHQTAQAGALSSLYTAQSVDKNTQVLAAMAAMQAQQMAQEESFAKRAIEDTQKENDYIKGTTQYLKSHPYSATPWH